MPGQQGAAGSGDMGLGHSSMESAGAGGSRVAMRCHADAAGRGQETAAGRGYSAAEGLGNSSGGASRCSRVG